MDLENFAERQATAYDSLLPIYEAKHEACEAIRNHVLDRVLSKLGSEVSALDVGCGAGAYLTLMAKRGVRAEGIDLSPSMAKAAQLRSRLPVKCADFRAEQFEGRFDLVFAQAFVHLFPKIEVPKIINKLKLLARRRLYFSTSVGPHSSEGWEKKDGAVRFRSRFTTFEFTELVARSLDGAWRAETFELVDPDDKRWIQVILHHE